MYLFPVMLLCQETDNKLSSFSLGISFSPEYSYRILKAKEDKYESLVALADSMEVPKFGFTTGIQIRYDILKRLSVESGIQFTDKGSKMTVSNFLAADTNDPVLQNLKSVTTIAKIYYIEVPLKLSYKIVSGKFSLSVFVGLSANIFLDNNTKSILKYNDGSKDVQSSNREGSFNSITVSMLTGIGLNYELNNKLSLIFEPIYKRDITGINTSLSHIIIPIPLEQILDCDIGFNNTSTGAGLPAQPVRKQDWCPRSLLQVCNLWQEIKASFDGSLKWWRVTWIKGIKRELRYS